MQVVCPREPFKRTGPGGLSPMKPPALSRFGEHNLKTYELFKTSHVLTFIYNDLSSSTYITNDLKMYYEMPARLPHTETLTLTYVHLLRIREERSRVRTAGPAPGMSCGWPRLRWGPGVFRGSPSPG